jgi:pimeloyl-ACP methyl ester carboxylesterase
MHALARLLGIDKAGIVGHDIGLMVASAYAAQYPTEVDRIALLDAFNPGVGNTTNLFLLTHLWHFLSNISVATSQGTETPKKAAAGLP